MQRYGWIEVIVGSMFSGKTEELLRRLRLAKISRKNVVVIKPKIDDRYHATRVTSHDANYADSITVGSSTEILGLIFETTQVVGIDEVQFFDAGLIDVVQALADRGIRVILGGLDTDWKGQPFGIVPHLMAIAESVTKQSAVCMICGDPAHRTQRIGGSEVQIEVGETDRYEARCRRHFVPKIDLPYFQKVGSLQNHKESVLKTPEQSLQDPEAF